MHLLQWLSLLIFFLFMVFTIATLAKQEKLTLAVDEVENLQSAINFEPAIIYALKQPHSLDDLLQREEWRDELDSLDTITSVFKDSTDLTDVDRLNAEETLREDDPLCANLPALLDNDSVLQIYPTTRCSPTLCTVPCDQHIIDDIEQRFKKTVKNEREDEPFCDEFVGSTDEDDEIVQSISNVQKQVKLWWPTQCNVNGHVLAEALRTRYRLIDVLHYSAFYWLNHNELGYAVYCMQNILRRVKKDDDRIRDINFIIAQLYFHAKHYKSSIQLLNQLAEKAASSVTIQRVLASRLLYTDNCTAALKHYKLANDLEPSLLKDEEFMTEWSFCRCREKVIGVLGKEQQKLQRQLDELNAYNDAMESELQLHSLINSKTISKQKFSDSWLVFSQIKFGPLPGLKCSDVVVNEQKYQHLQCKITNLLDYFGTAVKKLEDYRMSLENLDEHFQFMQAYDVQQVQQRADDADLNLFLERLRPNANLKLDEVAVDNIREKPTGSLFPNLEKSNLVQITQKLCELKLESSPFINDEFLFISPASRGFPVEDLLNKYLNLEPTDIHPLPWELPYCQPADWKTLNNSLVGNLTVKLRSLRLLLESPHLYTAEIELLPNMARIMGVKSSTDLLVGDFAQRVKTLMQFRIGPNWLHWELATMVFRLLGLFREAFDCIAQRLSTNHIEDKKHEDMALTQFFGMLRQAKLPDSRGDELAVLILAFKLNKIEQPHPAIRYHIAQRLKSGDALNFLWEAFEIDNTYRPALNALKNYYCNRKTKFGQPVQNYFQPICCWTTEHDIYCFKELSTKGACFKIEMLLVDDRVVHKFKSFRCSGTYVTLSFAPPPIAHFVVGFLKPARQFRDKLIRDQIDEFLTIERRNKSKEARANAKKIVPLDYGGFSKKRIAQFIPKNDDNLLTLETHTFVDTDAVPKLRINVIEDGELRLDDKDEGTLVNVEDGVEKLSTNNVQYYRMWNGEQIALDESYITNIEKSEIDFNNWQDIIRIDVPKPSIYPQPDPQLIRQGKRVFQLPSADEIYDFCTKYQLKHLLEPVSTYLSTSVKGVNIDALIDREANLAAGPGLEEPFCLPKNTKTTNSKRLFHRLPGSFYSDRIRIYRPQKALRDALLSMGNPHDSADIIGARLSAAMKKLNSVEDTRKSDDLQWALSAAAALYWRVKGNSHAAITCLIQSLDQAPRHMEDVAAISLANVYHQAGFLHSALIAGHYALQASGGSIVGVHFTLANIYISMGEYKLAEQFYFSTLALQSNFQAAKDRIQALQCLKK